MTAPRPNPVTRGEIQTMSRATAPHNRPAHGGLDALCLGETMVLLTAESGASLVERPALSMEVGGAESNVACGLAQRGHRAAWLSRVGDDPFGRIITETLSGHGVDVSRTSTDPDRPTGLYFKDPAPEGTTVHYYRSGSAASAMRPELAGSGALDGARLLHLSGITPALSQECAELVEHLTVGRSPDSPTVAFDVNYRPALWTADLAARALLPLALACDVVLVGLDEAETLWGVDTPDQVRELFPDVPCLVVKDGANGATCFSADGDYFVPALSVDVKEAVGAGDAFAAGFLSGLLDGRPVRDRLRLGHIMAAVTLQSVRDLTTFPSSEECEHMVAADETAWRELTVADPGSPVQHTSGRH